MSRLYIEQVDGAIADLETAIQLKPSDVFAVIWLHLAHLRAGVDDTVEMKQIAAGIDENSWPAVILQCYPLWVAILAYVVLAVRTLVKT